MPIPNIPGVTFTRQPAVCPRNTTRKTYPIQEWQRLMVLRYSAGDLSERAARLCFWSRLEDDRLYPSWENILVSNVNVTPRKILNTPDWATLVAFINPPPS